MENMDVIKEFENYQASEADALRAIRSHRNRRTNWRHMHRVRKARQVLLGLTIILLSIAGIAVSRDATFAVVSIPLGIATIAG